MIVIRVGAPEEGLVLVFVLLLFLFHKLVPLVVGHALEVLMRSPVFLLVPRKRRRVDEALLSIVLNEQERGRERRTLHKHNHLSSKEKVLEVGDEFFRLGDATQL